MTDETARLRQRLSGQLTAVLAADFQGEGTGAVKHLREKDPSAYLRAVAAATADAPPPEETWNQITNDELAAALAEVQEILRARASAESGAGTPSERGPTGALSAVPETKAVP